MKIIFENEKDAYAFLELCRIIAKVSNEVEKINKFKNLK
jgi:hypothetical protein